MFYISFTFVYCIQISYTDTNLRLILLEHTVHTFLILFMPERVQHFLFFLFHLDEFFCCNGMEKKHQRSYSYHNKKAVCCAVLENIFGKKKEDQYHLPHRKRNYQPYHHKNTVCKFKYFFGGLELIPIIFGVQLLTL